MLSQPLLNLPSNLIEMYVSVHLSIVYRDVVGMIFHRNKYFFSVIWCLGGVSEWLPQQPFKYLNC